MVKSAQPAPRRPEALSRESILEAAVELLDTHGEQGLTFRALSDRLATGPGALYWHIANKEDLLAAASDAVLARTLETSIPSGTPADTIRGLALGLFDTIDAHPWVGSALASPAGQRPMVRILEPLGQQVRALGVPQRTQWSVTSALLSYILGVGGRNAANGQLARARNLDRAEFLDAVATMWSELDPAQYPFTRSLVHQLRTHDDRVDFLAGIDLILRGVETSKPTPQSRTATITASAAQPRQTKAPLTKGKRGSVKQRAR